METNNNPPAAPAAPETTPAAPAPVSATPPKRGRGRPRKSAYNGPLPPKLTAAPVKAPAPAIRAANGKFTPAKPPPPAPRRTEATDRGNPPAVMLQPAPAPRLAGMALFAETFGR